VKLEMHEHNSELGLCLGLTVLPQSRWLIRTSRVNRQ